MSEMIIYRIYNKVNSKCYIGQSVNSFNERVLTKDIEVVNGGNILIMRY